MVIQTWMYLAFPVLMYACERLLRAFRSGYKTVKILKVYLLCGKFFNLFPTIADALISYWKAKLKLYFISPILIFFQVAVYPGNVLALHMSKPQGLKYTSGQYIYINCSAISPFQWYFVYD